MNAHPINKTRKPVAVMRFSNARPTAWLLVFLVFWAGDAAGLPNPRSQTESPGFWLLDLARDQAGRFATAPDRADAVEILCLLRAATRLDPQLVEAWREQYDLLKGLGRDDEALSVLEKYINLVPDDEPAVLTFLSERIAAAQTAEKRLEICRKWLTKKKLPPAAIALAHRTIATLLHNKLQDAKALQHARRAVTAFAYDTAARRLLLELQGRPALYTKLYLGLWRLRSNPADDVAILSVARAVDALGMHDEASSWYAYAEKIRAKLGRTGRSELLQTADHWLDVGQPDKALATLAELIDNAQASVEAYLLASEAQAALNRPEEAKRLASEALAMLTGEPDAPASQPSDPVHRARELAASAWIRLIYLDDSAAALKRAKNALKQAPKQTWARRSYGWALLKNGQTGKAAEILKPTARTDAWSALGLAQALWTSGDKEAAAEALGKLWRLAPVGAAWRAARKWSKQVHLSLPGPDATLKKTCRKLLQQFDKTLLELPLQPQKFLRIRLRLDPAPLPGSSWFGRIELSNISGLPVHCSGGGAFVPNVLLKAVVQSPAVQEIGQKLLLSLEKQLVLQPGQTVSIYRQLDAGPLRQFLRDPSKDVTVMFMAILDPVRTANGQWQPGACGLLSEPVVARRPAQPVANLDDLLRQAQAGSTGVKAHAARTIVGMLLSRQLESSELTTEPGAAKVDAALLIETLSGLLKDSDPLVVAHTLAELDNIALPEPLARAAAPTVGSPDWLVRLLAIRLFAHQHGQKFTRVLGGIAKHDPDPLVRDLAAAYHTRTQTTSNR